MKKLLLTLLVACGTASAQEAYVMPPGSNQVGDTIARDKLIYVLYVGAKCPLPIVNAQHMRRAEIFNTQQPDIGCWGKTLTQYDDSVVIIGPTGATSTDNLSSMVKTRIGKDGSATITEPSATLQEFRKRFPPIH